MNYRALILLLLSILATTSALAEDAPTFLLEKIEIRNLHRVSPDIIKAETRLREGRLYTERELREANDRVNRLPFVLDAQFSLEKGSVRDSYVLVVTTIETRPFFYLLDFTILHDARGDTRADDESASAAGLRFFTGRRGVVHVGAFARDDDRPWTEDYASLEAGYTQYDLFDSRAFATVSIKQANADAVVTPEVVVGIPLSGNQTLTTSYSSLSIGDDAKRTERVVMVKWSYNTTNHPFFPTDGVVLSVAPVVGWTDSNDIRSRIEATLPPNPGTYPVGYRVPKHSQVTALEGIAARYWTLSERHSIAVEANGGVARRNVHDRELGRYSDGIGYGSALVRLTRLSDHTSIGESEQRFEYTVRLLGGENESWLEGGQERNGQVKFNWVRRDSWGTLRLGVGFEW